MRIDARYNGPADTAHGGVACGVFAGAVDPRAAVVRLLKPPPLEMDMDIETDGDSAVISSLGDPIAQVRPLPNDFTTASIEEPTDADIMASRQAWIDNAWRTHLFPTCFGCGHRRPRKDGLELYAWRVPKTTLAAAYWTPDVSLVAEHGLVADWAVWAAVDCPSGGAVLEELTDGSVMLLGELALQITKTPVVGERYKIVAQSQERAGRRLRSEVCVIDADKRTLARGSATWIQLDHRPEGSEFT